MRAGEHVLGVLDVADQHQLRTLLRRIGEPRLVEAGTGARPSRAVAARRAAEH